MKDDRQTRLARVRATHGGITCAEFDAFIVDYLDDRLPPPQRANFSAHIETCPGCGRYLQHYVETRRAVALTADDGLPKDAPEELVDGILKALGRGA